MSRNAFNFYRSYYDVALELSDKDFCQFMRALLAKEFEGIEPTDLQGMAKFAYLSQKYSIDSQVVGYEKKTNTKLTPIKGGSVGGIKGGSVQEKEKEKVEYTKRPKKISFEDSELFDKNIFAKTFEGWNKEKLKHYYEAAHRYSVEGNKYVAWELAIRNWEAKDIKKGLKFEENNNTNETDKEYARRIWKERNLGI